MRDFYNTVCRNLDRLDFEAIFPGFHRFPFALYNDETIWLEDREIPQQDFYGCTTVRFEGRQLAIWRISQPAASCDADLITAGIVHEMFHAFQAEQEMTDYPDDLKLLLYPTDTENHILRQAENRLLSSAAEAPASRKAEIYRAVQALRELRKERYGDFVCQEERIEKWEGQAECSGMLALRQLAPEKYIRKLHDYADILDRGDHLPDVRMNAYYSGTFMRLLEAGSKAAESETEKRLREDSEEKESRLREFFFSERERVPAEGYICGYDPMNQFRVGNRLLATGFMAICISGEQRKLSCPVVVEMEPGSPNRTVAFWQ